MSFFDFIKGKNKLSPEDLEYILSSVVSGVNKKDETIIINPDFNKLNLGESDSEKIEILKKDIIKEKKPKEKIIKVDNISVDEVIVIKEKEKPVKPNIPNNQTIDKKENISKEQNTIKNKDVIIKDVSKIIDFKDKKINGDDPDNNKNIIFNIFIVIMIVFLMLLGIFGVLKYNVGNITNKLITLSPSIEGSLSIVKIYPGLKTVESLAILKNEVKPETNILNTDSSAINNVYNADNRINTTSINNNQNIDIDKNKTINLKDYGIGLGVLGLFKIISSNSNISMKELITNFNNNIDSVNSDVSSKITVLFNSETKMNDFEKMLKSSNIKMDLIKKNNILIINF